MAYRTRPLTLRRLLLRMDWPQGDKLAGTRGTAQSTRGGEFTPSGKGETRVRSLDPRDFQDDCTARRTTASSIGVPLGNQWRGGVAPGRPCRADLSEQSGVCLSVPLARAFREHIPLLLRPDESCLCCTRRRTSGCARARSVDSGPTLESVERGCLRRVFQIPRGYWHQALTSKFLNDPLKGASVRSCAVNAVHAALNFEDPALPDVELPLATPRLLLEPLKAADAMELVHVLADRTLYSFIGGEPQDLIALSKRFQLLETRSSPDGSELWLNWTVRLRDTHEAIGYVQATVSKDSTATIAYLLGPPWQHLGLASESVRAMVDALASDGIKIITAHIATGHFASIRVAEAAGLQKTTRVTDEGEAIWSYEPHRRRHT